MSAMEMPPEMQEWEDQLRDLFKQLTQGFQKLDKIKDPGRQAKQVEDLTAKMRECKRLIKEFDKEMKLLEPRNTPEINRQLNEKKQSLIKELNSFVALRKTYTSVIGGKEKKELMDGGSAREDGTPDDGFRNASAMSNQELIHAGREQMDETDRAIDRAKKVVEDTINVGAQTAVTLKEQTDQMGRIVNELDTIHFSIKKAAKMVSEIGRQVCVPLQPRKPLSTH
eukprot:TRINITY_DN11402_c0_g1_i1.p1 TRINITY_DN11402_c0_g1~~TRINITY_DN11402_c0_g1_i1.p1  ORF type:complete len:225 (+),score=64.34 TRINITY_DN11402_c0_g1_i1:286-960(+)